jgi:hypothetical protein
VNSEDYGLEPGEDAGLEPLGRYRSTGMSTVMRSVFDVLYEAGEPLDADTIITRTWERATSGARGYAMRRLLAQRAANDRYYTRLGRAKRETSEADRSLALSAAEAWTWTIRRNLGKRRRNDTLLVDERGRYYPNPDKPPMAERVDGSSYRYTRKAWLETTQEARTTGEVHTMTMEAERFLGHRGRDELLLVLEVLVDDLTGFGKDKRRPVDPRTIRTQLRWLLERPTTDESRAWLLHELTRRIYET